MEAAAQHGVLPLTGAGGLRPKVVIAGSGAAGLEALIGLRALAEERVDIDLLTPEWHFVYRPLAVGEPFGLGEARRYELMKIAGEHGARLIHGTLASVDCAGHRAVTADGNAIAYDALIVALGAQSGYSLPGSVVLRGPGYTSNFGTLLRQLEAGRVKSVAFASPPGVAWALPLYELALMTATRLAERGITDVALSMVTPESQPLELFGPSASEAIRALLEERGITLFADCYPASFENGELALVPAGAGPVLTERVVSLPQLEGPCIPGLPQDEGGFIPVDAHGQVAGESDVYAAGDATGFPIKQGGLATQQADAVVEALAARAGVAITPEPFRPVLRGLLLTGEAPRYLRAEVAGGGGPEEVSDHALWWPPSKIAGRYLSPYLGVRHRDLSAAGERSGVPVEIRLHEQPAGGIRRRGLISRAAGQTRILRSEPPAPPESRS